MQIILDGLTFTIIHRTNKKIKNIGILLENQNEIIVKTPLGFKVHNLRNVVLHHKQWILRSIKKIPAKNKFDFFCDSTIDFLGQKYPLEIIETSKIKYVKVDFKDNIFYFYHNPQIKEYEDFLNGLKKFYKKVAIKYIDPIFDKWCFITKLYPQQITYRYAKKRWGSCSWENNISINYMLLQFPIAAIEYVVLHELAHIKEKNHSKRFYNILALYMPNYKQNEALLKNKLF